MGLPLFGAESRLDDASPASFSVTPVAATGFPESRLNDDRDFLAFKWSATGTLDVVYDAGVGNTGNVDYFAMVGHDLFTQGSTAVFASSPDDIVYTTIFTVTPTDDNIVLRAFTLVAARFFRLRVTGSTAAPSISELNFGEQVQIPFNMGTGFDPQAERTRMRSTRSQTGNILGTVALFSERSAAINLPFMPNSFVNGTSIGDFKEFWDNHASLGKPFFWAWNPANPGNFEKDAFFAVIVNDATLARPVTTPLDSGFRDIRFNIVGLKE